MADLSASDDEDGPTAALASLSLQGRDDAWTSEEVAAVRATRDGLIARGTPEDKIDSLLLVIFTMICKLRVEKAIAKYEGFLTDILAPYGIEDMWADDAELEEMLSVYSLVGTDAQGRGMMWITPTAGIQVCNEAKAVRAGCLWYCAVHADRTTLRQGMTFVLDQSKMNAPKVGNEKKLNATWRAYPLRPQAVILIGGEGYRATAGRFLGNVATSVASRVLGGSAGKIAGRTHAVKSVAAIEPRLVAAESMPAHYGGTSRPSFGEASTQLEWYRARVAAFPRMDV